MASLAEARQNGEIDAFQESTRLNKECAASINKAIHDSHDGQYCYDMNAALKAVTAEYGEERVRIVRATTVQCMVYEGRFSQQNKAWAQNIQVPSLTKEQLVGFICQTHPAILDGFINRVRKKEMEKRPSVTEQLNAPKKPKLAKKKDASHHDKGSR
jgi:hypothetical protein